MLKASCCCGTVQFTLAGTPSMMATCHCSRCRKLGAAVFVFVKAADVAVVSGADAIARYHPDPPYRYTRSFCGKCGTSLGELGSDSATYPINAHVFDDALDLTNRFHEFVGEKPAWLPICDAARQFEEYPHKD